jgi:hypothetical protein
VVRVGAPWTVGRTGSVVSVGEVGAMLGSWVASVMASCGDRKKEQKAKRRWCRAFYVGPLGERKRSFTPEGVNIVLRRLAS